MSTYAMGQEVFVFENDIKGWGKVMAYTRNKGAVNYFIQMNSTTPVMRKVREEHCFPTIEEFHRYICSNGD